MSYLEDRDDNYRELSDSGGRLSDVAQLDVKGAKGKNLSRRAEQYQLKLADALIDKTTRRLNKQAKVISELLEQSPVQIKLLSDEQMG